LEYRIRRKDENWIWVHARADRTYVRDGVRYTDGVFSDVTARHHTEEALVESERRYRLLFERNLAGVFRALPDGRVIDCNEALLRILGYDSPREVRALAPGDIFYESEQAAKALQRLFRETTLTNHDVRLKRKDGTPVWVLGNASVTAGESGSAFIDGTIVDITARKQAE